MRRAIACPVPVRNLWQQHVRIIDMLRLNEDEILASKRSLVGRFGCCFHHPGILLIPTFFGLYRKRPDYIP